jgi:predicted heme/steroid binding protein
VSLAELAAHDASNAELWLCISGYVFDVTKGRYLYGAGSPRSSFAGACVGRALARGGTPRAEDHTDDLAGLDDAELARLDERKTYFLGKFPLVGVLERRDGSGEL